MDQQNENEQSAADGFGKEEAFTNVELIPRVWVFTAVEWWCSVHETALLSPSRLSVFPAWKGPTANCDPLTQDQLINPIMWLSN